ncbi:MAG: hypothetical protein EOP51_17605 [Sphingobacteriales bacterium]|nr:MAG: hypothetical protein EOP51_17605 [Sphingobacteriales bacterium]
MEYNDQDIVYRSKIGAVMYVILVGLVFFAAFVPFSIYQTKPAELMAMIPSLLIFVLVILFLLSFFNTVYTITNTQLLKVKSSFVFNKQIPITGITKIVPTKSILSAPALSLDRIEIFYNTYDSVVISPKDKQEFIAQLKTINPAIDALSFEK